jgi:hypothetical protein
MVILYGGKIRSEGTVEQLLEDSGRTVITVPRLSADDVVRVERVLRDTAHVEVERVAAPRQRLEDLFLQIVERARADQASTSGAQGGGTTAAFLRGEAQDEGSGLIRELAAAPAAAAAPAPAPVVVPQADAAVLDELVSGRPADAPAPTRAAPGTAAPEAPKGVDRSVIDDLLGGGGNP